MQRYFLLSRLSIRNIPNMKKIYTYSTSILLLLLVAMSFTSCERKWKETAPLSVSIKLVNTAISEYVIINSGEVYLSTFGINGARKQGDAVAFSNNLPEGTMASLQDGSIIPSIEYDIPQGTYSSFVINMGIKPKASIGSLALFGEHVGIDDNGEVESHRIEFIYNPATNYSLNTVSSGEINFVSDQKAKAIINLDAKYLLSSISNSMWMEAEHTELNGVETIIVSENDNTTIYNILVGRLNSSFSAHIEQ